MNRFYLIAAATLLVVAADAKTKFDYSVMMVPEEASMYFEKITDDADCVCSRDLVRFNARSWWAGTQIALSPDGSKIAYITDRNGMQNIMVKSSAKGGASTQRTSRVHVKDVTWSSDGTTLCFTEYRSGHHGIYLTNADQGSIVRQINNGNDNDYSGIIVDGGKTVIFTRDDGRRNYGLWAYDFDTHIFSNFSRGMSAIPVPGQKGTLYCTRMTNKSEGEIWRINYERDIEELILGQPGASYSTPQLSPDGQWLLCTGSSISENGKIRNTDIYVIRTDGTRLTQLTYHPGNDLSAIWSPDGHSIYFLSQRGSADRVYNVWKMSFNIY